MAEIINLDLHNKIENINKFLASTHDTSAYIYFKVNDFELDTRSSDSRKHYAISLENQKTGVGAGNQFTIKIAYHKDFSTYPSPDQLENALSTLKDTSMFINSQQQAQNLNRNDCILEYGYLNQTKTGIQPTQYIGKLLKYTVKANRQILEYTLTGYTGEQATIGTVNWYPMLKHDENREVSRDSDGVVIAEIMAKQEAESLSAEDIKKYIETLNSMYTGGVVYDPYKALECFIKDYNYDIERNSVISNATKFRIEDTTGLLKDNYLKPVRLSLCRNQTPLDYIKYLISMFQENATDYAVEYLKRENEVYDRWVYELKRESKRDSSDYDNMITVVIRKITSTNQDSYTYKFEGYAPDNNLLIDYSLDYDGTVALTVANTMDQSTDNNAIYIRQDGLISAKASITNDMFVYGAIDEVLVKKQNYWIDKISCANNCTMTTFGLPFEIPVSTVFQVTYTVGGHLHHTSGCCYVTGIVDKIENNNFTTNFTMVRLPGKGEGVETIV